MFKRFLAVFKARNIEFIRDKSSLSWNLIFPVLILIGFSFIFDSDRQTKFKVGVLTPESQEQEHSGTFFQMKYVQYIHYSDVSEAHNKLKRHSLDLVVQPVEKAYWVNESSPNGYLMEQLLLGHLTDYQKFVVTGREIRYVDWLLPGILGMNMMFSSLFGVGYVIVRYRKSSVLKRLSATPLNAFEFLLAQVLSRLFIVIAMSSSVFIVCDWMFDFYMLGSFLTLFLVAVLGALSMISLGLLLASRSSSEELTGGLLNVISWPMMILSGVWFPLEGAPEFMRNLAQVFPLTHLIDAARAVMTEGAGIFDLGYNLLVLVIMTIVFLALGASLFKWQGEN